MKIIGLILFAILFAIPASATEQQNDILIIGRDTILINSFPLQQISMYYKPFGLLSAPNTNCRRGYRAVWHVENDSLFLDAIYSCLSAGPEEKEDIADLLRKNRLDSKMLNGRVFADWYDADLDAITGPVLDKHIALAEPNNSDFPRRETILRFNNGILTLNRLSEYPKLAREEALEEEMRLAPHKHFSFYGGAWVPTGRLALLGNHPYLGYQLGWRFRQLVVNVSMNAKFLRSASPFYIRYGDSTYLSSHFFGAYIGIDVTRPIVRKGRCQLDLIGGIGYDGFDALKVEKPGRDDINKSLNGLNLNVGLGYRFYYRKERYVGLDLKYNFINYRNPGGTDLSGQPITIGLIFGFWE